MKKSISLCLSIILATTLFSFDSPSNWFKGGNAPDKYEMGTVANNERGGTKVATIQSKNKNTKGFGTLMQNFLPDNYLGKKVKMTAYAKSQDITGWAGFWLRIDHVKSDAPLSFDNMQDRPIKGTTDWKRYEITLDIPAEASNIAYGCLLSGDGQIWFDDFTFEVMGNISNTAKSPMNPNFEE